MSRGACHVGNYQCNINYEHIGSNAEYIFQIAGKGEFTWNCWPNFYSRYVFQSGTKGMYKIGLQPYRPPAHCQAAWSGVLLVMAVKSLATSLRWPFNAPNRPSSFISKFASWLCLSVSLFLGLALTDLEDWACTGTSDVWSHASEIPIRKRRDVCEEQNRAISCHRFQSHKWNQHNACPLLTISAYWCTNITQIYFAKTNGLKSWNRKIITPTNFFSYVPIFPDARVHKKSFEMVPVIFLKPRLYVYRTVTQCLSRRRHAYRLRVTLKQIAKR